MFDQPITLQLELPSEVIQQDAWDFEIRLERIAGVSTELREPKDPVAATLLFIHVVGPYAVQAVAVAGGINILHDLAHTIYTFLHPKKPAVDQPRDKNRVVIITKKRRIELYNLSPEEIEKIIKP